MSASTNSKELFTRLFRFLLLDRKHIQMIIFYGIAVSLLNLILPLGAQSIFSNINYGTVIQPVIIVALVVFCVLSLSAMLQSFQVYLVETVQKKIFSRTTLSISEFIPRVKWEAFDRINGPELMNRFFEVLHVQKMQALILMDGLGIALQIIIGLCLIAFYHPYLLAYDLLLIVGLFFVVFKMGHGAVVTSIAESKQKYKVASWLEEIAQHKLLFESTRGSAFAIQKTDHLVSEYIDRRHAHFRILFRQYIGTYGLFVLSSVVLFALGGWLVIIGELTLGQLVAAEIIVSGIITSFSKIGKYLESIYDLAASFDKLETIFDLPVESSRTVPFTDEMIDSIKVQNVTYRYASEGKVVGPFSFTVPPCSKTILLGTSGIGKSTLAEMLAGFREPTSGQITINDINLTQIRKQDLASLVGYVARPQMFVGTVMENITMDLNVLQQEAVHDFIRSSPFAKELMELPDGLDTRVLGHSGEFSDRITTIVTLLRALFAAPKILIVDQTLDAFDEDFQKKTITYMNTHFARMTIIMLTTDEELSKLSTHSIMLRVQS